jgi:hypothetical protein
MEPLGKLTDTEINQIVVDTIQRHFEMYPEFMMLIHDTYFDLWTILTADVSRLISQLATLTTERDTAIARAEKAEDTMGKIDTMCGSAMSDGWPDGEALERIQGVIDEYNGDPDYS